jgi:hypothetical protein
VREQRDGTPLSLEFIVQGECVGRRQHSKVNFITQQFSVIRQSRDAIPADPYNDNFDPWRDQ